MAASIKFFANIKDGVNSEINHTAGSGLGFYGAGFGVSVPINSQQSTTFITNADGTSQGSQLNNTAVPAPAEDNIGTSLTAGKVSINSAAAINNNNLPNYLCPLNIRFTNDEAVRVQNCKLRIFDRNSIDNPASGVTTYVYEARHPSTLQNITNLSHRGRNSNSWVEFNPSATISDSVEIDDMIFTSSPGMSGLNTNTSDTDANLGYVSRDGANHISTTHDWYIALSSEPETIGSKTQYGLYFSVEYL